MASSFQRAPRNVRERNTSRRQRSHQGNFAAILFAMALVVWLTAETRTLQAAIVDSADVPIGDSSFRTFTDSTTSLRWLDLDNFWDATSTYNSITSLLAGSGFHLATLDELQVLQASIPAIPANFAAETLIAGGNYLGNPHPGADRDLLWGIYEDGDSTDGISHSFKYGPGGFGPPIWDFASNVLGPSDTLRSGNTGTQDLGAWIVADSVQSGAVPEPATSLIWTVLALACGIARRRSGRTSPDYS